MTANHPFRRLARTLALASLLCALAAALVGASQTHGATCSTSGAHAAKATPHTGVCAGHKGRPHHGAKHHGRHGHAKTNAKGGSRGSHHRPSARCEDGSLPSLAGEGGFSCADGSQPECEDGATPSPSSDGKSLVCLASGEDEAGASEPECEEDEEEETSCTGEPGAQACEASGVRCEAQG